jgi:hypothetical protein
MRCRFLVAGPDARPQAGDNLRPAPPLRVALSLGLALDLISSVDLKQGRRSACTAPLCVQGLSVNDRSAMNSP